MDRRTLLGAVAGGVLVAAHAARAQPTGKVYRIGVLGLVEPDPQNQLRLALVDELRQRGYVEGHNLVIERRYAAGQVDRLPVLAAELVALRPHALLATAPTPSLAVKDTTSTIPIVFWAVADPVRIGLVASLVRPGANVTGMATIVPGGFYAKTLELLHQAIPTATRIAALLNPDNPMHTTLIAAEVPPAARRLGLQRFRRPGVRRFCPASATRCSSWTPHDPRLPLSIRGGWADVLWTGSGCNDPPRGGADRQDH